MPDQERQTRRLLARKPTLEDRDAYQAHFKHPEVERWLRPPPLPPFETRVLDELLEGDCAHWSDHGFGPWILVEKESGKFAGRGGLAWTVVEETARIELPWSIEPHLHGQGLATEAATAAVEWAGELRIEEVVALVLPANVASQRVAQKAGFEESGKVLHASLPHVLYWHRIPTGQPAS